MTNHEIKRYHVTEKYYFKNPFSSIAGAAYIKLNDGELCSNSSRIESASNCEAAAKELGLKWQGTYDDVHGTPGCIFVNDGRSIVQLNTNKAANQANARYAEICGKYDICL